MATSPFVIFGDESSQTGHDYFVIGALIMRARVQASVIKALRYAKGHYSHELKWERLKKRTYKNYERAVDAFFTEVDANRVRFHCIIVDAKVHKQYCNGDSDLGFSKLLYQLLH